MTAVELHQWVLRVLEPLGEAALREQASLLCSASDEDHDAFMQATGRHQGLMLAGAALLDLVAQLGEQERTGRHLVEVRA